MAGDQSRAVQPGRLHDRIRERSPRRDDHQRAVPRRPPAEGKRAASTTGVLLRVGNGAGHAGAVLAAGPAVAGTAGKDGGAGEVGGKSGG